MQRGYWRRVRKRALADTFGFFGLGTWKHVVIQAAFAFAAIVALIWLGSPGAARDDTVARAAIIAAIILTFPFVYVWKLIGTPAKLDRELQDEKARENELLEKQVSDLALVLEARPRANLLLVNKQNEWWVEISTFNADAYYSAFLDYSEANGLKHPVDTVHAQWSITESKDTERFIPAGGRGRIFLYGVSDDHGIYKQVFRFVRDGLINEYSGHYAWTDGADAPPHRIDRGIIKVIVSARPPLQGGSLSARFAVDGHSVSIIEGEVQIGR